MPEVKCCDSLARLADLSSQLGCGLGDDSTTPMQYYDRIQFGLETLIRVEGQRREKLESTVSTLRKALEYIADPIGSAKRKVKESNGELKLDVSMAIALSESANHLRGVARTALEETK